MVVRGVKVKLICEVKIRMGSSLPIGSFYTRGRGSKSYQRHFTDGRFLMYESEGT